MGRSLLILATSAAVAVAVVAASSPAAPPEDARARSCRSRSPGQVSDLVSARAGVDGDMARPGRRAMVASGTAPAAADDFTAEVPRPIRGRAVTRTGSPVPGVRVSGAALDPLGGALDPAVEPCTALVAADGTFELIPAADRPHRVWVGAQDAPFRAVDAHPGDRGVVLSAGDALLRVQVLQPSGSLRELPAIELGPRSHHNVHSLRLGELVAVDGTELGSGRAVLQGPMSGTGTTYLCVTAEVGDETWRAEGLVLVARYPGAHSEDVLVDVALEPQDR